MIRSAHTLFLGIPLVGLALVFASCRSPSSHREKADRQATRIIERHQQELFQRDTPFTIESPADTLRRRLLLDQELPYAAEASLGVDQLGPIRHWPEKGYPYGRASDAAESAAHAEPMTLTLLHALQIGARNSREYQSRKEDVYRSALDLDVEQYRFRTTLQGSLDSTYIEDRGGEEASRGIETTGSLGASQLLKTGAAISAQIFVDLAKLLTLDKDSAVGLFADLSISVPLLRGAGRHIVAEPLTQAERDVIYAMYTFEHYKSTFSVRVASEYLAVLQQFDQVRNAEDNYQRLALASQRAQRLAEAGRLPETQVDQARQEELRARDRWLESETAYARRLDQFKVLLGLPTDARIRLDEEDLYRMVARLDDPAAEAGAESAEWDMDHAIRAALDGRLDLRIALGRVYDAQRAVTVAADALRMDLNLTGSAAAGERRTLGTAADGDGRIRADSGSYRAGLSTSMPWSRHAERSAYRDSFIALERSARDVQELEDQIKLEIRSGLRALDQVRESIQIQRRAVELARRRVDSTELFLQAGRVQMRDLLEAQESLISAQNALTAAVVNYRVAEWELQRDMGVLAVAEDGLWVDYEY